MTLTCSNAAGTQQGESFEGSIAPVRPRDAASTRERDPRALTHVLVCAATAPVAAGLVVRTPAGRAYTASKLYEAQASPHQRQWGLIAREVPGA